MKQYITIYENEFISKFEYKFIGMCDRLRLNSDENESKWQNMMENKKRISDNLFLQLVDINNVLDEDEDAQAWVAENKRQDIDAGAYKSNWGNIECILFQVAGFEYIFIKNNQDIVNENAFIPIFESPDTIYYKTINWEDSDPSFKRPKYNSVYNSIDALAFGIEEIFNFSILSNDEAAITPFGFTHSNSYVVRDGWMIRMRHASRETFNFPGRIWLKDKIISFYGAISSKDAKRVIPLLQKSISDFYDSYLLFNKNYEKNRNETKKLFYKYFDNIDDADQHDVKFAFDEETNHLEYIHKNIEYLKEIKENGLGDFFIEYSEYDEETEIGKIMIFKVSDFINKDYTGSKPTEEELSMEHTVSPLEKTKEPVPSGIGSQKEPSLRRKAELSGVAIGEMKSYAPIFENPDFVSMKRPNLGFDTFEFLNPNTIAFGIINNELKIGHLKSKHTELLDINNGKITSLDDYDRSDYKYPGRIWIGSNIISFWEYPKSYELKQILIDIQKELKKLYDIYKPVSDVFDNELSDHYTPESLYIEKPKEYFDLIKMLSNNEVLDARDFDLFDQYHHQIKKIIDNGMDMFIVDFDSDTGEPMEGKPVLDYMKSNTIINTNKEQVEHMESPLKKKNNNYNYNKGSEAPMTLKRKAELSGVAIGESANTVSKGYVLKELEDEYGIDLELWDNGNCLILHKIIIPKSERKLNIGTEIMNKIINYADGVQKPIFLTPSIDYGATSVNRLKRFYRQFGFEKNKDTSTTWESMVRFPKLNEMKSYMKVYENFVPILENKWDAGILERDELNEPITDGDDVYVFRAASKKEVNNVLNNNDNSGAFWGSKLEYSNDFHMVAKSSKKGISFAWNMKREPDNIKAVVDEYGFKDIRTPNETFERNYDPHFDHFQQVGTKYKKEDIVAIYDERNNLIYSNQDKEINELSGVPIGEGIKQYVQIFENSVSDWQGYVDKIPMLKSGIEVLDKIIKIGNENNITDPRAYIVGGTIRDIITGQKEPDDIDIATNVPVDTLEKHFKTFDIGKNKDFGIIVALHGGHDFEIANFRKDGTYSDGRRPDDVKIVTSYEDDASRRDFTINAMGVDKEGNIIDYFDGKGDIKDKKIRTVGDPTSRITEDPVRMLRGVRFASTLNFDIDDETFAAIKANAPSIGSVSKERITKELYKMADQEGPKFAKALEILYDSGLLQEILPDIAKMKEFEHNPEHHPEGSFVRKILKRRA